MLPVSVIDVKMRPCFECSSFVHSWYDEAEVVNDGLLFVCSTTPRCLLWLHHTVRSLVGIWLSDLRATFPMNVSCRVAICSSMLSLSKKSLLTVSFVMRWSFNSVMMMPSMSQMLRCRNTSRFFRRNVWSAQISHTHSSRLMVMARKIRYLLRLSTLASVQNLARASIYAFPADRSAPMY